MLQQWLKEDWHRLGCTALLAQNDMLAIGVLDACREAGIRVPEQLSVVGFDDLDLCEYLTPALTSVAVPLRDIGAAAMELLLHRIETGRSVMATTTLPVRLKARASTGPPGIVNSDIRKERSLEGVST